MTISAFLRTLDLGINLNDIIIGYDQKTLYNFIKETAVSRLFGRVTFQ